MTFAPRLTAVVRQAPGKVNLYLRVTGRRDDGYHELDSLIAFTELHDVLTLRPAAGIGLSIDGPFADSLVRQTDNLVVLAARRLRDALGRDFGAEITLTKNIPVAAGLGGGSADAAAALSGLCELWGIEPGNLDLTTIGAGLGADVPVCLYGKPALVAGIGAQIERAPKIPAAGLLLVNPGRALPTSDVFRGRFGPFSTPKPLMCATGDMAGLAEALAARGNDLMAAAIALCPDIELVLDALNRLPSCRYAGMSGSGATCFGLFDDANSAARSVERMGQHTWWVAATALKSAPASNTLSAPDLAWPAGGSDSDATEGNGAS